MSGRPARPLSPQLPPPRPLPAAALQPARAAVDCSVDGYNFYPYKTSPGSDVWTDTDDIRLGYTVGTGDEEDYEDPSFMAVMCDWGVAGCLGFDSQFRYFGRVKSQVRKRRLRWAAAAAAARCAGRGDRAQAPWPLAGPLAENPSAAAPHSARRTSGCPSPRAASWPASAAACGCPPTCR